VPDRTIFPGRPGQFVQTRLCLLVRSVSEDRRGHTLHFLADGSLYRTAARLNCIPPRVGFETMAFDEGSSEALEAEKSSRNILRFVWILFVGIVLLLAVALMYVDFR
jgi:hypothetical protein